MIELERFGGGPKATDLKVSNMPRKRRKRTDLDDAVVISSSERRHKPCDSVDRAAIGKGSS
jgi:hypothetical protein